MSGPEHYAHAEYLLAQSIDQRVAIAHGDPDAGDPQEPDRIMALAQVHATLALAAATALGALHAEGWADVAAAPRRPAGGAS